MEKVLVIDDEEIKLADCPAAVRAALHEHANGGEIGDITRSTGIGQHYVRGRGQDQGQGLLDRGRRERALDLQVARGRRRLMGHDRSPSTRQEQMLYAFGSSHRPDQRIERATFSSRIACWTCPLARAWPLEYVPWLCELHVNPLQSPQSLAHPIVGLGLGHPLRLEPSAPRPCRMPSPPAPPACRIPRAPPLFMPMPPFMPMPVYIIDRCESCRIAIVIAYIARTRWPW